MSKKKEVGDPNEVFERIKGSCASFGEARRIAHALKGKSKEQIDAFLKNKKRGK